MSIYVDTDIFTDIPQLAENFVLLQHKEEIFGGNYFMKVQTKIKQAHMNAKIEITKDIAYYKQNQHLQMKTCRKKQTV